MKRFLDAMLPGAYALDNARPEWLLNPRTGRPLELDRYYPEIRVAFEFQGDQHFIDDAGLSQRVYRDQLKRHLCAEQGVYLVSVLAIDLEFRKMQSFLRKARVPDASQLGEPGDLTALNRQATEYRESLRERLPEGVSQYRRHNTEDRLRKYKIVRKRTCQANGWDWKGPVSGVTARPPKPAPRGFKANSGAEDPKQRSPSPQRQRNKSREYLLLLAAERTKSPGDYWATVVEFLESIGRTPRTLLSERQQLWLDNIEHQLCQ